MKSYTRLAIIVFQRMEKARHRVHFFEAKLAEMMGNIEAPEMADYVAETQKAIEDTEAKCKPCSKIYPFVVRTRTRKERV